MTAGAQQTMRRTMEKFSNSTRFALACNHSTKIIEPIQSRCAILRYTRLTDEQITQRLLDVVEAEKIVYDNKGLEAVVFTAEGDMRQALNNLQATATGFGNISTDNVFKVCDQPHPVTIQAMVQACIDCNVELAIQTIVNLSKDGYAPVDVISTLFRVVKAFDMNEALKLKFIKEIGQFHMYCVSGMSSLVQLTGMVASLCVVASESR